jgi:hypothetical protein
MTLGSLTEVWRRNSLLFRAITCTIWQDVLPEYLIVDQSWNSINHMTRFLTDDIDNVLHTALTRSPLELRLRDDVDAEDWRLKKLDCLLLDRWKQMFKVRKKRRSECQLSNAFETQR